ncbi:MAG: GGDEF domain-containing protein [Eubacteriales bacterium]|nr:GGDEF domain-containing protein [Eubacteriales bacterium]
MEKGRKQGAGGIKIKNVAWAGMSVCIVLMLVTYLGISRVKDSYEHLMDSSSCCVEGYRCAVSLERSSDYLTEEVRMFVLTMEAQHMWNYFEEVDSQNREKTVKRLGEICAEEDGEAVSQLRAALEESKELEEREVHAMKLICTNLGMEEERLPASVAEWELTEEERDMTKKKREEESYRLVYGKGYLSSKHTIKRNTEKTLILLADKMESRQKISGDDLKKTLAVQKIYTFLMMLLVCIVIGLVGILVVYPVTEHVRSIEENQPWKNIGGYEIRCLASVYNQLYARNNMYREELKYKAEHDTLTGICNREVFQERKNALMGKDVGVALLLVDIDEFKHVNDSMGHDVGDEVLRRVAQSLKKMNIEERYCVARIGGDEFALILRGVTTEDFSWIASEIDRLNEQYKDGDEVLPPISISGGIAFSESGYVDTLFHQADKALYYTKHNGRRGCTLYDPTMETQQ